jgi:hypothetical protein
MSIQGVKQRVLLELEWLSLAQLLEILKFISYLRFRNQNSPIGELSLEQQLAQDYDDLATIYPELAADISDEIWLPIENEALAQIEEAA